MAAHSVDLGRLSIESAISSTQLQLVSQAQFAPSVKDVFAFGTSLTAEILKSFWICRSKNFRLVLGLRLEGGIEWNVSESLGQAVAARLQEAEVSEIFLQQRLHGLTLGVDLEAFEHATDGNTSFNEHGRTDIYYDGVPFYDLIPPAGSQTAGVDAVHLTMTMSQTEPRMRRRTEPRLLDGPMTLDDGSSHPTDSVYGAEEMLDPGIPDSRDVALEHRLFQEPTDTQTSSGFTSENTDTSGCLLGPQAALAVDPSYNIEHANAWSNPIVPRLLKHSSSTSDIHTNNYSERSLEELLRLIDGALRLAIAPSPMRLAKGIKLVDTESLQHLAEIFPAIWSPGYLTAVSSRAVFLPTICHAMADIGFGLADNAALKAKMAEVVRRVGRQSLASGIFGVQGTLTTRLWEMLRAGLWDEDAARGLKPLLAAQHGAVDSYDRAEIDLLKRSEEELLDADLGDGDYSDLTSNDFDDDDDFKSDFDINLFEDISVNTDNIYHDTDQIANIDDNSERASQRGFVYEAQDMVMLA